jgi:hypothetical protein
MKSGMVIRQEEQGSMIIEHRASAVLYHYLISKGISGEFVLPVNICPVVPVVFNAANIRIKYCDINGSDYCIDYQQVIELVNKEPLKYSGVLFNHTYGFEKSPTGFFDQLKNLNSNILIIDDKCLCTPDLLTDSLADLTLFSTGYAKYVDLNIGGIGILKSREKLMSFNKIVLADKTILRENSFRPEEYKYFQLIGEEHPRMKSHKQIVNNIYSEYLQNVERLGDSWNNWRFNILIQEDSGMLLKEIFKAGFFASKHYKPICSGFFPNAQKLFNQIINLFNDRYISIEKAEELAKFLYRKI